jgi:hypothetical protein
MLIPGLGVIDGVAVEPAFSTQTLTKATYRSCRLVPSAMSQSGILEMNCVVRKDAQITSLHKAPVDIQPAPLDWVFEAAGHARSKSASDTNVFVVSSCPCEHCSA